MNPKTYDDDAFGTRKEFGNLLYAFLQSEHILADESFVVALTGGFGSGKSHFLSMWETEIRNLPDPKPMVVHVNAWESDHSGEPVLALVSAISKQLSESEKLTEKAVENLKSAAAGIFWGSVAMAKELTYGYFEEKTGVDAENVAEAIKEGGHQGVLNRAAKKLFSDFDARQSAIGNMTDALKELIGEYDATSGLKLIIVVDELDRCRPTYAIDMLEALKHLFNVKGLGVLIAVDWDQLSCTAEALFGTRLNTTEYFRKFVSRKIPIPDPGDEGMKKLVSNLWDRFISSEHLQKVKRFSSAPALETLGRGPTAILMGLEITRPRQVEDFFRLFSHLLHVKNGNENSGTIWQSDFWAKILLTGLCVINPSKFSRIAQGKMDVEEILGLVYSITRGRDERSDYDLKFIESDFINHFTNNSNRDEIKEAFYKEISEDELAYRKHDRSLPHFLNGWEVSPIIGIARHIDTLKSFSER